MEHPIVNIKHESNRCSPSALKNPDTHIQFSQNQSDVAIPLPSFPAQLFNPPSSPIPIPEAIQNPSSTNLKAIRIRNVFTKEECDLIIQHTKAAGYEQALVNIGGGQQKLYPDYRNGNRCTIDSKPFANEIWRRIEPYYPDDMRVRYDMEVSHLNERLRFLHYNGGGFFSKHQDGAYIDRVTYDQSFVTFQLYLNDGKGIDCEGGGTSLFQEGRGDNMPFEIVEPEAGMVLLFDHDVLHSGDLVVKGNKYALRSDVMFTED